MPRAGLSRDRVIAAAVAIVEEVGLEGLTLARLAGALGVRTPSLYKHVAGLDDVRAGVAARASEALAAAVEQAALGRSRDDAVRGIARAYRRFGRERPALYAALPLSHLDQPEAVRAQAERLLRALFAVFSGYDLDRDGQIHAIRAFRSAVWGFVQLEAAGGFGLDADADQSFAALVELLIRGTAR